MGDTFLPSLALNVESDLSVQVLNSLFGQGWASLADQSSGGVLGDLLFSLFGVLNCCCAIVVAWLFILTTLSATLGAAQDGAGVAGRRYSNAWIPLRYSFAMGAVTPIFNGLNAMQLIMLSAVSVSIQFADSMWATGLEQLGSTAAITAKSQPVTASSAGRVLPVLLEHHVLKTYFKDQESCVVASSASPERSGWSMNRYVVSLEFPRLLACPNLRGDDGYGMTLNPALHFGDLGGARVSTPVRAASEALAKALAADGTLYEAAGRSTAAALSASEGNVYEKADIGGLARLYQETVSSALADGVRQAKERQAALWLAFREQAASQGWWLAGSYYWTLARLAAESVEAMQDRTEAVPVRTEALSDFLNPDLERALALARELGEKASMVASSGTTGNPVAGSLSLSGREQADLEEEGGLAGTVRALFSGASHAMAEFALDDAATGTSLVQLVSGHDLVFNVVRSARVLMNVCENAVAGYVALKLTGRGLGSLFNNPLAKIVAGAASEALDTAAKIALCLAAPVWVVCWFYAYMLPMLPFIAWVTAVLGWLVLCLEAMAACPVWLVAHCMPEGDGFAGASARAGYALFMSVLLRPMLLVLSFFLCMVIMSVSGSCMGALLLPFFDVQSGAFAVSSFGTSGWGVTASISTVILTGLVTGIFTWKVFGLITVMPDRIIRWAGQLIANLGDSGSEEALRHGRISMDTAAGRLMPPVAAGTAVGVLANMGHAHAAAAGTRPTPMDRELAAGARANHVQR